MLKVNFFDSLLELDFQELLNLNCWLLKKTKNLYTIWINLAMVVL